MVWAVVWLGAGTAAAGVLSWSLLPLLVLIPAGAVTLLVRRRRPVSVSSESYGR